MENEKTTENIVKPKSTKGTVAVLRVRGLVRIDRDVQDTLRFLNLNQKNSCSLHKMTPSLLGMLKKVKDYATWGEVDSSVVDALFNKRGEEYQGKLKDVAGKINYASRYVEHKGKKYKKYFRLPNPKGGFDRKGIKTPYALSGALGYRGEAMNVLLKKML